MTLRNYIQANELTQADNATIVAAYNASPTRYATATLNFLQLGEALANVYGGVIAGQIGDKLIEDVTATAPNAPSLGKIFNKFVEQDDYPLNFASPLVRDQLTVLVASPGPLTAEDAGRMLSLLTDTHGGDATEQDAIDAKAAIAADLASEAEFLRQEEVFSTALIHADAAARAAVTGGGSYAECKAAWIAEFDSRVPA